MHAKIQIFFDQNLDFVLGFKDGATCDYKNSDGNTDDIKNLRCIHQNLVCTPCPVKYQDSTGAWIRSQTNIGDEVSTELQNAFTGSITGYAGSKTMLSTHDADLATFVAGVSNVFTAPVAGYARPQVSDNTNSIFASSGMTTAEQAQLAQHMQEYQVATGNKDSAQGWARSVAASTYNSAHDQHLAEQKEIACIRFATSRSIAKTQLTDGFHYNLICRPTANCGTDNEHYINYYQHRCGHIHLDGYQTNYSKFTPCPPKG